MDSNHNLQYTIYKTTNLVNGKMYIGCHKTSDLNDGYIGSGTILKRAIKKYGRTYFKKEILFVFDTANEMFAKEEEIIDRLFVESDNTYNLLVGGWGGFDHVNTTGKNLYGKNGDETHGRQNLKDGRKLKSILMARGQWEQWKRKVSENAKKKYARDGFHWSGRKHREESKLKIGKKLAVAQKGNRNSQYGTCWVYSLDLKKSLRIKKDDLSSYLEQGFLQGRKMAF